MKSRNGQRWRLRLYVAGQTPNSVMALDNLSRLCDEQLPGRCRIEVIDLLRQPQLARRDDIIAVPTLVRRVPPPIRKVIGDLSNERQVLLGLGLAAGQLPNGRTRL